MSAPRGAGEDAYDADVASSYEADRRTERIWGLEQAYMERAIAAMAPGTTLLDIPVGTGRFIRAYEARRLEVTGVDLSESMLAEARRKSAAASLRLEIGDARSLRFDDGDFDVVVCWRLFHLLPPEALPPIVAELARVGRGSVYVQAYVRDGWHRFLAARARIVNAFGRFARRRSAAPAASSRWSHITSYAHDDAALRRVFAECGLELRSVDVLGTYGTLRVKVYVLRKPS